MSGLIIRALSPDEIEASAEALAAVLVDCVEGGASISFMADFGMDDAVAFFRDVAAKARGDGRVLFVAEDAAGILGTVQLVPCQIPNQPHRADLSKMLVHSRARRLGAGAALLAAAEAEAVRIGRTLLTLDTVTGDPGDFLYRRCGWTAFGVVPGFALYPDGRPCDATFFYKVVG